MSKMTIRTANIDKDQNSEGQKYAFDIAEQIARGDL